MDEPIKSLMGHLSSRYSCIKTLKYERFRVRAPLARVCMVYVI